MLLIQRDITCRTVVIWVKHFQIEFMVEIYSKSVVRAIGKVFCMKLTKNTNPKP